MIDLAAERNDRVWDAQRRRWYRFRPEDGARVEATAPYDESAYSKGWNACLGQIIASLDGFRSISKSYSGEPDLVALKATEETVEQIKRHIGKLRQS